ncbi:hypothetical protein BGW38_000160 [Lunasporangiospora selenospora]|uniref:Uncharacterized protein n=1 Tax=Lunasporangiospora selenospora TaxID=979761 RepID=A0A9P6KF78_9FUNG|nr:hypothetical protein BGW38_000160 [Lunasporangiospora selenospora]
MQRIDLIQYKNAILPVVVPAECAIACLYWYLTLKDVYNIYPDGVRYLPLWLDLQMHGVPFISAMIEMFFHSESLRICRVTEFVKVLSFGIFYIAWSSICAHMNGEWPYPVFQKIACPWERLRMMVTSTLIGLAMHVVISEYYIWLKSTKVAKKSKDPSVTSSEPCQS